ncbi:Hypothetical protein CINCED_3A018294 [Cinara cedri]|uniref:Aminopeptidase n=1 Tax=Cinara cedri TaxID=506608 RepID=A0A5E4N8B2_9HEMI|nr:Hypothetical protein CINCED_3A018294 [Cinara cedri]
MLFLVFFVAFALVPRGGFAVQNGYGRLPDNTVPETYVLSVVPNFETANASFTGHVCILVEVKTTTPVITLNSKDLVIHKVNVTDKFTNRNVKVNSWKYAVDHEQVEIYVDEHVLANRKYTVCIFFRGILRDDGIGFFRSSYTFSLDSKKWLAATQFRPIHARSAFPCYDEPKYRTPFNLSLKINRNEIALSNTPILNTVDVNEKISDNPVAYRNMTWVHFEQTPPLATHSVGFFVGEFEILDENKQDTIKVYTHVGKLYQTEYITGGMSDLLKTIVNCTGVEYAQAKLDLLAVPELGLRGAVENWGLNTYREKLLLVDGNTMTKTKVSVKTTVERIIAQQWFGDLVTPTWWSYAWLNEGFATYFEYFATATLEPEWLLEHFFVVEIQQTGLEYDQTRKHPLSASVSTTTEFDDIFDKITNNKGAAVLRMLNDWVGDDVFKKALNIYLTQNRYKGVMPKHLWNSFDNALFDITKSNLNGHNVHTIMNSWTSQAGYPVVEVGKTNTVLVLTQERFSVGSTVDVNDDSVKWFFRSSYTTDKDRVFNKSAPSVWLDPAANETIVSVADDVQWYIFNVQSTGFYRVNYAEDNWLSLIRQLNSSPSAIHVLNRAQLIDDSFNLARAGRLNYSIPLSLLEYLRNEDDVVPWLSAMNCLEYVVDRMRRSQNGYDDVKAFVSELAGVALQKVNNLVAAEQQNPRYPSKIGWNVFSTWACKLDNTDCIKTALNYFRRWQNGEEIPADIKDAAFCTGVKHGNQKGNWERMLALYKSTKTYSEKESALRALACTDNVQLLVTNLKLLLENNFPIEQQDYRAYFEALSSSPSGIAALSDFLKKHFTDIVGTVKDGEHMVTTIYSILASKVSTKNETDQMSSISSAAPVKFRKRFDSINRNAIEDNEKWFIGNSVAIREFVKPGSTVVSDFATPAPSSVTTAATQSPATGDAWSMVNNNHYAVLLQILALSISVKFFDTM